MALATGVLYRYVGADAKEYILRYLGSYSLKFFIHWVEPFGLYQRMKR